MLRSIISLFTCFLFFSGWLFCPPTVLAGYSSALHTVLPDTSGPQPLKAGPAGQNGRVVVVLLDRIGINDINSGFLPQLSALSNQGAMALLNTNTGGGQIPENTYATIGAGAHIRATGTSAMGFNANEQYNGETAGEEYAKRTAVKPPVNGLVHLGIAPILRLNAELPYPAEPGALGEAIHANGKKTAALGNSDSELQLRRQLLTVAMDSRGIVDYGLISSESLIKSPHFLNGYQTDYEKLLDLYKKLPDVSALTVFELGDLSRLDDSKDQALDKVYLQQRMDTLKKIDNFLGELAKTINLKQDLLLIITPTSGYRTAQNTTLLTPIIAVGPGVTHGFLTSSTTKRPGIVMNTDIAPTILSFLDMDIPTVMTGQPMQVLRSSALISKLDDMHGQLALTYNARAPLQKGYIIFQLILLAVSLYCIFRRIKPCGKILKPFLLAVMAVPLVYLLLPLLPQPSIIWLTLELILLSMVVTGLTLYMQRRWDFNPFILLCLVTSILILLDILLGSPMQKSSILGYDPIVGARFYGIGNEYMGILIGSSLIGITAVLSRLPRFKNILLTITGVFFLVVIYLIAAPNLGTNVGGTIASGTALFTTYLLLLGIKFNGRTILLIASGVVALVMAFIIFDLSRPVELQSHIGRAATLIITGGLPEVQNIISRKLEINIKLIKYTIWSRIFLASLGTLALLFYRPVGVMASIRAKYPYIYKGFIGVIVGSIAAFAFNDSGVVAAATTMVFGAPPLIYLVLQEINSDTQ